MCYVSLGSFVADLEVGDFGAGVSFYVSTNEYGFFVKECVIWCLSFECRGFLVFFPIFVLGGCVLFFWICGIVCGRCFWWVVFAR
jgi:hypothetical protein